MQIADWLEQELVPRGVGVVLSAEHTCMTIRGVPQAGRPDGDLGAARPLRDDAAHASGALQPCRLMLGDAVPLIETVVTTTGSDGVVNCAAMGVRWGEDELVFWPFDATRTMRNLRVRGEAVVHLTDDVLLFVQAALGHPRPAVRAASAIAGSVIEEANSWREVVVTEITP